MLAWIDRAASSLFDATVSNAFFLTLIMLITLCCRQPARRILIARVAILASLVMIPLVAFVPIPRLDLVEMVVESHWLAPRSIVDSSSERAVNAHGQSVASVPGLIVRPRSLLRPILAGPWPVRTLAVFAFTGMGIGLAWLLLGLWGIRWLFDHSREPSISTSRTYRDLTDAAGGGIPPTLRVSDQLHQPSIFGILHPVIFIPTRYEDARGVSSEAIRLSLLHEIAHANRADSWFRAAASLAQSIWFFLPQIWWLRSQLMIDQEFLADHTAAVAYGTSTNYASSLVSLAGAGSVTTPTSERLPSPEARVVGDESTSPPSILVQRVLMLLHCPFPVESDVSRSWTWFVRLSVISACLLTACLCVRWPDLTHDSTAHGGPHHSLHHNFQVAEIIARPQLSTVRGRSLPFVLPLALPTAFEIVVDLQSSSADLRHIRLVDLPLAIIPTTNGVDNAAQSPSTVQNVDKRWHQVRLVHRPGSTRLTVDGQDVPISASAQLDAQWLTIEPSLGHPAVLRELQVTW